MATVMGDGAAVSDSQTSPIAGEPLYSAFVSYSHQDEARTTELHRRLERYRVPRALVGRPGATGPIPRHLKKIFRDQDELQAGNLTEEIQQALAKSDALIVICSPAAAQSPWVNREIAHFKALGKGARIFPAIVAGEPHAAGKPGFTAADECFPPALLNRIGPEETVTDTPDVELIAADLRPGKDREEAGALRLIAGLLGVGFDDLIQREKQAERRRRAISTAIAAVMTVLALGASVAAVIAIHQQQRAHEALVALLPDQARDILDRQLALNAVQKTGLARAARFTLAGLALSPSHPGPFRELLARLIMANKSDTARAMRVSCLGGGRPGAPQGQRSAAESPVLAPDGALDADGGRLVLACPDGSVHLWDVDHNRLAASAKPGGKVLGAAFAPDGQTVLIAGPDGSRRAWDPVGGSVRPLPGPDLSPAISAIGGEASGTSLLADHAPAPLSPAGAALLSKYSQTANAAAVSADGHVAYADGAGPAVVTIEPPGGAGQSIVLRDVLSQGVTSVAFSPDSTRLATTDREGRIRLWSVHEGTSLLDLPGGALLTAASFSGDGKRIVIAQEGQAAVWDVHALGQSLPVLVRETCSTVLSRPGSHQFTKAEREADPMILELWSEENLPKDTDLCVAAQAVADRRAAEPKTGAAPVKGRRAGRAQARSAQAAPKSSPAGL
jgi:hypothetical protein